MLFPLPVSPIIATLSPASIFKLRLSKIFFFPSYEKETFFSSIEEFGLPLNGSILDLYCGSISKLKISFSLFIEALALNIDGQTLSTYLKASLKPKHKQI